jgi:hypothetical protein
VLKAAGGGKKCAPVLCARNAGMKERREWRSHIEKERERQSKKRRKRKECCVRRGRQNRRDIQSD